MTAPDLRPPRWAERLLERAVPDPDWRACIVGDLAEEFTAAAGRTTRRRATVRYIRAAAAVAVRYRWRRASRLRQPGPRHAERRTRKGDSMMARFAQDVRFALRMMRKRRGLTAVVVLTLGFGLGANAAVFSLVDALLLRPFPIEQVHRVVVAMETQSGSGYAQESVSPANYLDWKAEARSFERFAAAEFWNVNFAGRDEAERLQGFFVSADFLPAVGVTPVIGRGFQAEDEVYGSHPVAILGHGLWARRFASDPAIVGQTVRLDAEAYTVIGVAPPDFDFPMGSEIWAPLSFSPETARNRRSRYLTVFGRLADGLTRDDAAAELAVITERLRQSYPDDNAGMGSRVVTLAAGMGDEGAAPILALFQASALLILLIGCANVANLLFAAGAERQRELAVRLAIGAGRGRVLGQMLIESALMALAAIPVALFIGWIGLSVLRDSLPARIVRFVGGWREIDLDGRLVAVTALLAISAAIVSGMVPALQAVRPRMTDALKDGGRGSTSGSGRRRVRSALVVVQVATALTLLIAAGLSIAGTWRFLLGPQGYGPDNVLTFRMALPEARYADEDARRLFASRVIDELKTVPAVDVAALANTYPSATSNASREILIEGQPEPEPGRLASADYRTVTPGFLSALRIPVLSGRDFSAFDRHGAQPAVIVSRSLAERHWPGQDAIGKRLRIARDGEPWLVVVGVAGDIIHDWFSRRNAPTMYRPYDQAPSSSLAAVIRTAGDPSSITADARAAIRRVDADQPIFDVYSLRQALWERMIGLRYLVSVMFVFAGLALVLAAVGLYSLMAFLVAQRTHEIGVRMALGATGRDVFRLTMGQAGRLTAMGIVIGLVLAAVLGQVMASALFGLVSLDVRIFAAFALVLLGSALLASYLPARRAVRIDPTHALRAE